MARGRLTMRFDDLSGGVRRGDPFYFSPALDVAQTGTSKLNELRGARDVTYDRRTRLVRRRYGNSRPATFSGELNSIIPAYGLPGGIHANQLIIGGADGTLSSLFAYNPSGGIGASFAGGLAADAQWSGILAPQTGGQGPLFLQNGVSTPQFYTGGAGGAWTASTGTLPIAYYLLWHGNRVWAARTNLATLDGPSTVAFSELGDPRNWPAANQVLFAPQNGQYLTGIGSIGPYVIVFKRTGTWLIYDLDTGANRQLSAELGCISHRTIVETERGTYFLSHRGLALCDGANIKLIEDKLNFVDDIDLGTFGNVERSHAAYFEGRYYLAPTDSSGDFQGLFEYDPEHDAWWPHSQPMRHMAVWSDNDELHLYGLDIDEVGPTNGLIQMLSRRQFANQEDDYLSPAQPYVELPGVDFGTSQRKRWRGVTIEGRIDGAVVFEDEDGTISPTNPDVSSLAVDPGAGDVPQTVWVPRPGAGLAIRKRLQATLYGTASGGGAFELAAVTYHADLKSP